MNDEIAEAGESRPRRHLLLAVMVVVLGLVAGLVKSYLTVGVSPDGLHFIDYARDLGNLEPARCYRGAWSRHGPLLRSWLDGVGAYVPALTVMEYYDPHPGYPLLLLASKRCLDIFQPGNDFQSWIRAAQLAGALAWIVLALGCLLLGRELLGMPAALVGTWCLAVSPFLVDQRSNALSDVPALACLILSCYFAVRVLRAGKAIDAIGCGLAGGLGYLVRPEALQVVCYAALLLGGQLLYARQRHHARLLLLLACSAALLCVPYMIIRGQVLTRSFHSLSGAESMCPTLDRQLYANSLLSNLEAEFERRSLDVNSWPCMMIKGLLRFWSGWCMDVGRLILVFVLIGLVVQRRQFLLDRGYQVISCLLVVNLVLLPALLYARKGYLDPRHVLPTAVLTSFWVWPGLLAVLHKLGQLVYSRAAFLAPLWRPTALAVTALFLITLWRLPHVLTPLHAEQIGERRAAAWLQRHLEHEEMILDPDGLVSFHGGLEKRNRWWQYKPEPCAESIAALVARYPNVGWIVLPNVFISANLVDDWDSKLSNLHIVPARSFSTGKTSAGNQCQICLYRVERADS
ncbi:MAG: ArnT family glycosyltransferase [Gemmataceae bacterium]